MTAEWSLQLLSTTRVIIFSPLSLVLAGTKQPSQKSLPCSLQWLENDIKPDIVFPSAKREEDGKKEKKHKAATNEENGWGPAGKRGGSGKSHTHTQTWNTMQTHTATDLHTHRGHTTGHIECMHYTHTHTKKEADNHTCCHDTNGLWLESISQKTSDTNGNHISDLVLLQKRRRGPCCLMESFFFCRK